LVAALSVDVMMLATAAPPDETPSAQPAPRGGALVICGGGVIPDVVRTRFIELAGGPKARIIVIPTAHRIADTPAVKSILDPWMTKGAASVQCLHTRSRDVANSAEFVQPLTEATGVWFGGGLQTSVTQAYLGTEVERQLSALLARGGVIGGTSAGAAVMTQVMISRGRTTAEVEKGFDFLPGAVVDQHFLRRNRLSRLLSVLSDHPDLVGLGIDERTALVVNIPNRRMNVIGESYVVACVPGAAGRPARLEVLKPGDEASYARLTGEEGPALTIAPALRLGAP
jgi:cyanophycinase